MKLRGFWPSNAATYSASSNYLKSMITQPMKIMLHSEHGDRDHPGLIEMTMDGSKPDCPITLWRDGKAIFSMGCDEIHEFTAALESLNPS